MLRSEQLQHEYQLLALEATREAQYCGLFSDQLADAFGVVGVTTQVLCSPSYVGSLPPLLAVSNLLPSCSRIPSLSACPQVALSCIRSLAFALKRCIRCCKLMHVDASAPVDARGCVCSC